MPNIALFSGTFSKEEPVVQSLQDVGYKLFADKDIVARASNISGIAENKVARAFSDKTSVFNKFTHEKERSIAYLRLALAEILAEDKLLILGFVSHLVPLEISNVLRVCLIADMKFRIADAAAELGLTEKEAVSLIHKQDEARADWVNIIMKERDPWAPSLYDMVIPADKTDKDEGVALIIEHLDNDLLKSTDASKKAVQDFLLQATAGVALAKEGHNVDVNAKDGLLTLTINKHVLMLSRLKDELKSIAERVAGVKSVATRVGKNYYQADIYRKHNFEMPSKVLLVDDEREFVQTLSERLLMRDMGSAVAYDGESALQLVEEDEPEVMILDLKMPGIDGIGVLKRVKATCPQIEVIILTGHGSEKDRKICMDLGAFAYLQKPVDINILTETLKKANEKISVAKAEKR